MLNWGKTKSVSGLLLNYWLKEWISNISINIFFSQENRLNYADVVFQPTSQNEVRIIGLEDRTVYADVDTYGAGSLLPETRSETSSSEDDFVYVDGIENFIEKRETND